MRDPLRALTSNQIVGLIIGGVLLFAVAMTVLMPDSPERERDPFTQRQMRNVCEKAIEQNLGPVDIAWHDTDTITGLTGSTSGTASGGERFTCQARYDTSDGTLYGTVTPG